VPLEEKSIAPLRMPIATLAADPENPREIGAAALEGLGVSLEEFGDLSGIVFNEETGELVCGHQRVQALRAAGASTWERRGDEAWVFHPETDERFSIRIVRWDRIKQRMANLVANNPKLGGSYTEAAFDQIRSLEHEARFADLLLPELEAQLDKELARAEKAAKDDEAAQPPPTLPEQYLVMVTCADDKQQAKLLEELAGRGLKVRALIQ